MESHALARRHHPNATEPGPKLQDWSLLVIAGILFVSPWVLGTGIQTPSSWNAWIVGVGFIPFTGRVLLPPPGAYAARGTNDGRQLVWWQSLVDTCKYSHVAKEEIVVGVWLVVSPWVLGFAGINSPALTAWAAGVLVLVLGLWKLRALRGE